MKATGIVRKFDTLGRIVVPIELRRTLGIESMDPMEIYTEDDGIVLEKYKERCFFCDEVEEITTVKSKNVCRRYLEELKKMADNRTLRRANRE